MNLINEIGSLALSTRMQKLGDSIRKEASMIYKEHGVEFESKWFPVVYLLSHQSPMSVVELANELGHSHPSVIALVKELQASKLVKSASHKKDGRKRLLSLTPKAVEMVEKMKPIWDKMVKVNNAIINNKNNLLRAIEEAEEQLTKESFYDRYKKLENEENSRGSN